MIQFLALIDDPLFRGAGLPLLAALVATGALRLLFGRGRGPAVASGSIALGFLVAYALILGLPNFPPNSSVHKIPYLVCAGLVLGLLLDLARNPAILEAILVALAPAGALAWFAWARMEDPTLEAMGQLLALWLADVLILARLHRCRDRRQAPAVMLLLACLGAGAVAFIGASLSLAQLAFGLAAATGGFLLWNWPVHRYPLGAAGRYAGAGALLVLVDVMVLFSEIPKLALSLLILVFFCDRVAARLAAGQSAFGRAMAPVVLGVVAMIPVVAAGVTAYLIAGLAPS
ncbi:MAG: hypothetical protein HY246_00705 [Proteobacteria bacterium]|nr:hypothetical protein [Pseudomonadota bacterium]